MLLVDKELLEYTVHADRVDGGHNDAGIGSTNRHLIRSLRLDPVKPLALSNIEADIEEALVFGAEVCLEANGLWVLLLELKLVLRIDILTEQNLLHERVKLGSRELIDLSTDTPNEGEDNGVQTDIFSVSGHLGALIIITRLPTAHIRVEKLKHIVDDEVRAGGHGELAVSVDESYDSIRDVMEDLHQLRCNLLINELGVVVDEGGDEDIVAKLTGLKQDHTTTRDGSRRGLSQILDLEHDGHRRLELDNSTRRQAKLLIVIEHSVHVFDPNSIDGTIEDDPLAVVCITISAASNLESEHAIGPFTRVLIVVTVKLRLQDGLGVDIVGLNWHKPLVVDSGERVLQDLDDLCLSREGTADHHQTVSNHDRLIKLDALFNELGLGLEVECLALLEHRSLQLTVVRCRQFNAWEEIVRDTRVKWDIIRSELG